MIVIINGKREIGIDYALSYEQIANRVGLTAPTITYRYRGPVHPLLPHNQGFLPVGGSGTLAPGGDRLILEDGIVINALDTSGA